MNKTRQISSYFKTIFTLDLRSLALLRVGVALISLYNLTLYYPNFDLFFGPLAVVPVSDHRGAFLISLHALSDNIIYVHGIFILHFLISTLLLLGIGTRWSSFLCWFFTMSLYNRAPEFCNGGDDVLRSILLWGMFLPWGERFSIDSRRRISCPDDSNTVYSTATVALIFNLIILYLINGFGKTDPAWTRDFTALYYYFNLTIAKPITSCLLPYPHILMVLTCLTLYLERFAMILFFFPSIKICRMILIIIFVCFHLLIDISLSVGWFSWVMIVYWLGMVPADFWDRKKATDNNSKSSPRLSFTSSMIVSCSLIILLISDLSYLQSREIQKEWRKTAFFRISRALALDQYLIKFAKIDIYKRKFSFTPIFENNQNISASLLKKYRFDRTPSFRISRILLCRDDSFRRRKYYTRLKEYLKWRWNNLPPQSPRVKDVMITVKTKLAPPFDHSEKFFTTESF